VGDMDNIEILSDLGYLGAVRQRQGADGADDISFDEKILKFTVMECCQAVSGWELGSGEWGRMFINMHKDMQKLKKMP
jgi:hypothetical protein